MVARSQVTALTKKNWRYRTKFSLMAHRRFQQAHRRLSMTLT
ncbi:MAG: hypothetical protein R2851_20175 [Caldilineaceae bacterium]